MSGAMRRALILALVPFLIALDVLAAESAEGTPTSAPPAVATPGAPTGKNTIKWRTATEKNVIGYNVFRSEGPDGPFVRANRVVIRGAGTSDDSHEYVFVDEGVDPAKTYYYYVEVTDTLGTRKIFTPLLKKEPKPATAPAASPEPSAPPPAAR